MEAVVERSKRGEDCMEEGEVLSRSITFVSTSVVMATAVDFTFCFYNHLFNTLCMFWVKSHESILTPNSCQLLFLFSFYLFL